MLFCVHINVVQKELNLQFAASTKPTIAALHTGSIQEVTHTPSSKLALALLNEKQQWQLFPPSSPTILWYNNYVLPFFPPITCSALQNCLYVTTYLAEDTMSCESLYAIR